MNPMRRFDLPSSAPRGRHGAWSVVLLALLLVGASAGCARHRTATLQPKDAWTLRVDNRDWLDVRVYVLHGGQSTRVGTVTAVRTAQFQLPGYLLGPGGDIQLLARPVGDRAQLSTEVIIVQAGQRVDWFIPRGFEHSAVSVH